MTSAQSEDRAPQLLTTQQAAEIAGVGVRTIRRWVESGHLPAVQRRPKMLIDREDLDQLLRSRTPPIQPAFMTFTVAGGTTPQDDKPGDLAEEIPETHDSPDETLTIREAARLAGVHRRTLQKAIASGRLRPDANHRLTPKELARAGYPLKEMPSEPTWTLEVPALRKEIEYLRQELETLRVREQAALVREREAIAREQSALRREQAAITREEAALAQWQMRPAGNTRPDPTSLAPAWKTILGYLNDHPTPKGQAPAEVQAALQLPQSPRYTMRRMARAGVLERVAVGRYRPAASLGDRAEGAT